MKKFVLSLVLLVNGMLVFGQNIDSRVFSTPEFVWCGIDFSKMKCIGPEGFTDPDAIKDQLFSSWNNLIINESDKYDMKKAYSKTAKIDDLSVAKRRNKLPDASELVIDDEYAFQEGTVEDIIQDYNLEKTQEGMGLVYIVESFNKTKEEGTIYLVFFDIASKEILWKGKYVTKPAGFGVRNFWARTVLNTMEESAKDYKSAQKRKK
jgi:hypothetical protein